MSRFETQKQLDEVVQKIKAMSGDQLLGNLKESYALAHEARRIMDFGAYKEHIDYSRLCEDEALNRMDDRHYNYRKVQKAKDEL